MVNKADFDLSELDDEGRNIADWAADVSFSKLATLLSEKGIEPTWPDHQIPD